MWVYSRYGGNLWLADILAAIRENMRRDLQRLRHWVDPRHIWRRSKDFVQRQKARKLECLPTTYPINMCIAGPDPEKPDEPTTIGVRNLDQHAGLDSDQSMNPSFWLGYNKESMSSKAIARHRWKEAGRRTIEGIYEKAQSAPPPYTDNKSASRTDTKTSRVIRRFRIGAMIPVLQKLAITHKLHPKWTHQALVSSLQFSPDGKSLATSRYVS